MIRFVYDLTTPQRLRCRELLDDIVDPIRLHLPGSIKANDADFDQVNVHLYHDYGSDVFINHGISDKGWRDADAVGDFRYIFHSGPAWQRKYREQGIPADRLRQVGYTKLDPVFALKPRARTVLWAPSLSRGWQREFLALEALLTDAVHSLHPFDAPSNSTTQDLVDAEVVVADVGSTVYEAWALGKPVVFPDYAVSHMVVPSTFEETIYRAKIGYHANSPRHLLRQIDRARSHGITQAEQEFIEDIFPSELRGVSGWRHATALQDIADQIGPRGALAWSA